MYLKNHLKRVDKGMANHKSAIKRIRQNHKKEQRNRFYRTRIKNMTKAVREAVKSGEVESANSTFRTLNKEFHKYVSKGVLKKNSASRKVSRLNILVNSLNPKK